MSKLLPHETLALANEQGSVDDRAKVLKDNDSFALRTILQLNFDDNITLDIPEGEPPFERDNHDGSITLKRIDNALKPLGKCTVDSKLHKVKKERIFLEILESINENDAKVIIAAKDCKLRDLYPKVTKNVVQKYNPLLVGE